MEHFREQLTIIELVKKFSAVLWNQMVHYHFHKTLPVVPFLSLMNPAHNRIAVCGRAGVKIK
jgi:hypothetical protein